MRLRSLAFARDDSAYKGTRVVMAVRSANRHHYPILQKPLVIPNEAQRNEESHGVEQILKKQIVIPNEAQRNEESHGVEQILRKNKLAFRIDPAE